LENIELISKMVSILHSNLKVPVFCKIRILPKEEDTLKLAKAIEAAGCQLLAVHGRTKENKGRYATRADWDIIRKVKETLKIPVVANGSISDFDDIKKCLTHTTADGVMVAYPHLLNPRFFAGKKEEVGGDNKTDMALEYLDMCDIYGFEGGCKTMRGHIFKLLKDDLVKWPDLYELVSNGKSVGDIRLVVAEIEKRKKLLGTKKDKISERGVQDKEESDEGEESYFNPSMFGHENM